MTAQRTDRPHQADDQRYDGRVPDATAARVLHDLGRGPGSAVRLDSGDLEDLARRARAAPDAAGLPRCASSPAVVSTSTA